MMFWVFAAVLSGLFAWRVYTVGMRRRRSVRALATVIGHRQRYIRSEENPNFWQLLVVVEFQTTGGQWQRAETPAAYSIDRGEYPRFHSGERVEITYDPKAPSRIRIFRPRGRIVESFTDLLPAWIPRELSRRTPGTVPGLLEHLRTASASTPYSFTVLENRFGRAEFIIELDPTDPRWSVMFERYPAAHPFSVHGRIQARNRPHRGICPLARSDTGVTSE
ncbi:DUF3592 domain-containing protein [Nocardia concava]|uniref:DUF3592 domain-containing protein n=1 Tax=Nocardia concava TaxID=257281 RepID=UPI000313FEE3|nr:DUF3592 domain-containing protein [Nocardia concava]